MISRSDDSGQMLLATGIVLMLSLLSMAWFGVSVGEVFGGLGGSLGRLLSLWGASGDVSG